MLEILKDLKELGEIKQQFLNTQKELLAVHRKLLDISAERDRLFNYSEDLKRIITQLKSNYERSETIMKNPFALLKEFVPDLDLDNDGVFNILTLTKEEQNAHYREIRDTYNSMSFNREISAMVNGLQAFMMTMPETSIKGFEAGRQCLAFVKGMVDRFKTLAIQYDASIEKNKKSHDRTTPIG